MTNRKERAKKPVILNLIQDLIIGNNNKKMMHKVQHDEGKRERNNKKNRHPELDSGSHDLEEPLTDAESSSA